MPELESLKATQLSAKLGHAWKRLRTFELEVRNGLPTGPNSKFRDRSHAGQELADVMRYLQSIADELEQARD